MICLKCHLSVAVHENWATYTAPHECNQWCVRRCQHRIELLCWPIIRHVSL